MRTCRDNALTATTAGRAPAGLIKCVPPQPVLATDEQLIAVTPQRTLPTRVVPPPPPPCPRSYSSPPRRRRCRSYSSGGTTQCYALLTRLHCCAVEREDASSTSETSEEEDNRSSPPRVAADANGVPLLLRRSLFDSIRFEYDYSARTTTTTNDDALQYVVAFPLRVSAAFITQRSAWRTTAATRCGLRARSRARPTYAVASGGRQNTKPEEKETKKG